MKVLFINISDIKGGSAKAAYRLGECLEKKHGTENIFLVRSKYSDNTRVLSTRRTAVHSFLERSANVFMNLVGLQYQWLPFSPQFILKIAKEFKPDIISLHNIIGGYFRTENLIELAEIAPIVWTIHDMWPFTRNATHTNGDETWKALKTFPNENRIFPWIGINTGNWLLLKKKKIYSSSNITLVAPSKWIFHLAKESPVFNNKRILQIYHGIDTSQFKPRNKSESRKELEINNKSKVLLFVAENIKKGGKELQSIISALSEKINEPITFIILGNATGLNVDHHNIDLVKPGYIYNDHDLSDYYTAADLFVFPSKQETLGLVLIEAIACGVPCITFNSGGCGEIIKDDFNGYVVENFNSELVADKIIYLLGNEDKLRELSVNARKFAEDNFSVEQMAEKYLRVFESVKV